jgi:hypothetical protein
MLGHQSENVLTGLPPGGVDTTRRLALSRIPQRLSSQQEVISSPDQRQNGLLDALYKLICLANKVKMVLRVECVVDLSGDTTDVARNI